MTFSASLKRIDFLIVACSFLQMSASVAHAEKTSQSGTKNAIENAIPFLWEQGQEWIDKRGCVSCHQVPFMAWSLNTIAANGFEVDREKLDELNQWAVNIQNFDNPNNDSKRSEREQATANIDTMTQLLLAVPSSNDAGAWREKMTDYLLEGQNDDGSWTACGQLPLQKRPKEETTEVTTMWTALALIQSSVKLEKEPSTRSIKEALAQSPQSTEWWAARLLLAETRDEKTDVIKLQSHLLSLQHEDGGWGWISTEDSDAFGTGVALYALRKTGCAEEARLDHAVSFLVTTQQPNGSWEVRSTKTKNQKQVTPTATYWGTAWAVIGLLE